MAEEAASVVLHVLRDWLGIAIAELHLIELAVGKELQLVDNVELHCVERSEADHEGLHQVLSEPPHVPGQRSQESLLLLVRLMADDNRSPISTMDLFDLGEAGYHLLVPDLGSADLVEITLKYGLGMS